jgi:hypothetical protein
MARVGRSAPGTARQSVQDQPRPAAHRPRHRELGAADRRLRIFDQAERVHLAGPQVRGLHALAWGAELPRPGRPRQLHRRARFRNRPLLPRFPVRPARVRSGTWHRRSSDDVGAREACGARFLEVHAHARPGQLSRPDLHRSDRHRSNARAPRDGLRDRSRTRPPVAGVQSRRGRMRIGSTSGGSYGSGRRVIRGGPTRTYSPGGWRTTKPENSPPERAQRVPISASATVSNRQPATSIHTWPALA